MNDTALLSTVLANHDAPVVALDQGLSYLIGKSALIPEYQVNNFNKILPKIIPLLFERCPAAQKADVFQKALLAASKRKQTLPVQEALLAYESQQSESLLGDMDRVMINIQDYLRRQC
jgi:hypothetical protein